MSLGKFDEESLLEFREKALLQYGDPNLSQDFNVFGGLIDRARRFLNRPTQTMNRANTPQRIGTSASPIGTPSLRAVVTAPDLATTVQRERIGTGSSSSSSSSPPRRGSTSSPRPQAPRETEAQREARLRREREAAERREQERREAEERIRQQRIAAENARKERLQAITRDVANRVIENALDREASNRPDSDSQLCQRPDGSIYGIALGRRCVTGEPIAQRPENDPTQQINEAARNNPDQQMMPANQRTVGGTSPANSADARVSGQQTETTADTQSNMA